MSVDQTGGQYLTNNPGYGQAGIGGYVSVGAAIGGLSQVGQQPTGSFVGGQFGQPGQQFGAGGQFGPQGQFGQPGQFNGNGQFGGVGGAGVVGAPTFNSVVPGATGVDTGARPGR